MAQQAPLNGIDFPAFQSALGVLAGQPQAPRGPKVSRVRWVSGFKFQVQVRDHAFTVDEPPHLTGDDTGPSSMDYVLGAYGSCLATGFVLNATRRGITVHSVEVTVESTQNNTFAFLGLNDKGHPGFDAVSARLSVRADADEKTIRDIWQHTARTSPVGNSLARNVELRTELAILA